MPREYPAPHTRSLKCTQPAPKIALSLSELWGTPAVSHNHLPCLTVIIREYRGIYYRSYDNLGLKPQTGRCIAVLRLLGKMRRTKKRGRVWSRGVSVFEDYFGMKKISGMYFPEVAAQLDRNVLTECPLPYCSKKKKTPLKFRTTKVPCMYIYHCNLSASFCASFSILDSAYQCGIYLITRLK